MTNKKFIVRCPSCMHEFNLEYWECQFDWWSVAPTEKSDDFHYWKTPPDNGDNGEYLNITCKNCGYREKID